jgi:tetratricopeptide (TPR) repeat protein
MSSTPNPAVRRTIHVGLAAGLGLLVVACGAGHPTNYEADLSNFDHQLAAMPKESDPAARAELLFRRAALTGAPDDFLTATTAADDAIQQGGPVEDFLLAKADLDLKRHRPVQADKDLGSVINLQDNFAGRTLQADIDVQRGKFDEAFHIYRDVINEEPTWDRMARLGYLEFLTGNAAGADTLYSQAEDEITSKEMRAYAWVEVQRGALEFGHGHNEAALTHYQHAERAYSGYWAVQERIAELLGAQRRFSRSISLYRQILDRTARPEIAQALGDLYVFMGLPEEAKPWHDRALTTYLASVKRGDATYVHQLTGFYADVLLNGPEAVKWAQKDLEQRGDPTAHDGLAWALYRDGQYNAAFDEMHVALAPRIADAHLFFHASMISAAAGHAEESRNYLQQAATLNPEYTTFHAHR